MHTSYILLIATGVCWLFSFVFFSLRDSGEGLKESIKSPISPEQAEKRYNKYNQLKKWSFIIGILLILAAAAVAVVPRLIEINAAG